MGPSLCLESHIYQVDVSVEIDFSVFGFTSTGEGWP